MGRDIGQVMALCGRCGVVEIAVSSIVVRVDPAGAQYGLTTCPGCSTRMWEELETPTGDLLIRLGARCIQGSFSPEVLEHRPGPPITERDVKRFARALRRSDPAEEARRLLD